MPGGAWELDWSLYTTNNGPIYTAIVVGYLGIAFLCAATIAEAPSGKPAPGGGLSASLSRAAATLQLILGGSLWFMILGAFFSLSLLFLPVAWAITGYELATGQRAGPGTAALTIALTSWMAAGPAYVVALLAAIAWTVAPLFPGGGGLAAVQAAPAALAVAMSAFLAIPYLSMPALRDALFTGQTRKYFGECSCTEEEAADGPRRAYADPGRACIMCWSPHGVFTIGMLANGAHSDVLGERKPIEWLIAPVLCHMPLFRLLFVSCATTRRGGFGSSAAANLKRALQQKATVAIIPGGFEEATAYEFGKEGLIKHALRAGASMYPVWTFNESRTFGNLRPFPRLALALNAYQIPGVLPYGEWYCPLLPRKSAKVHTVIGRPLLLPTIQNPSEAQVNEWHGKYIAALKALHARHRAKLSQDPTSELEIA